MDGYKSDIALAVKGDCDAFARLYSLIYKELYAYALYSLRNEADAQDAVSDAVMDAFAGIKKLKDEQAFKAWFFKILSAKIKRKQKEYANAADNLDDFNGTYTESGFADVEIAAAMNLLSDDERTVLSLSAIGGYKTKEIAKICDMNHSTVRSKISRARQKLSEILQAKERRNFYEA